MNLLESAAAVLIFLAVSVAIIVVLMVSRRFRQQRRKNILSPGNQTGRELQSRFVSLGNMLGMTIARIESVVGSPDSRSFLVGGRALCHWQRPGYEIAILFKHGLMETISTPYRE